MVWSLVALHSPYLDLAASLLRLYPAGLRLLVVEESAKDGEIGGGLQAKVTEGGDDDASARQPQRPPSSPF